MIRSTINELRSGYRWPDDSMRGVANDPLIVRPTRADRAARAARWGWLNIRERVALWISPDGRL